MLTNAPVTTVLPVLDPDRSATFYRDTLGLQDVGAAPGGGSHMLRTTAGATIELLAAEAGAQSDHTVASFEVDDLAAEIAELQSRGVTFEDYDQPGLTTVDHIATFGNERAAWFADTDGNILCLHQRQE